MSNDQPRLRGMSQNEMIKLVEDAGFEAFRGKQLFHWIFKQGARSLEEMKNLPQKMREWLQENTVLGGVKEAVALKKSADGSYKFLFLLEDDKKVESVLMPAASGKFWTQCLSSQVGCAVDCKFCVTGFNGFFRQMKVDEIVDQVLFARRHLKEDNPEANYRNLVYMGMGEPLLNPDHVIKSIQILTTHEGVDLSPRRITVSTSGIVPGMIQLAEAKTGALLALSLNAPTQHEREEIMPITKKYLLKDVMDVTYNYAFGKNARVTYEYVLLAGLNDSPEHAKKLREMLSVKPCKLNIIPFNPSPLLPYKRPTDEAVQSFVDEFRDAPFVVSVRWSKALDVDGACGQLAGQHRQRDGRKMPEPAQAKEAVASSLGDLDFFAPVAVESQEDDDTDSA